VADTWSLNGSHQTIPLSPGNPSGRSTCITPLEENLTLKDKSDSDITLIVDTPVSVPFGTLAGANVVVIKPMGGGVTARLSSAAGTTQVIPIDTLLVLVNTAVPITAIDLTRTTAVSTTVSYFLGEKF
jgi:hypothetical protein